MAVRRAVLPEGRGELPVAAAQAQSLGTPLAVPTGEVAAVRVQLPTVLRSAPIEVAPLAGAVGPARAVGPVGKAERTAPKGAATAAGSAGRLVGGEWSAAREAWPRRPEAAGWLSAEERRAELQAGLPPVAPAGAAPEGRLAE